MQAEIIEEEELPTDILEKEFRDLSDSEKAKIVLELNRFALSDEWVNYEKELNESAEGFLRQIEEEIENRTGVQELLFSQFDRDTKTYEYMLETLFSVKGESVGAKIFKNKLEAGAKQYKKQTLDRIEPGYDAPVFTALDFMKNERLLRLSAKVWLQQTINAYEKAQETPETQSAY